MKKTYIMPSMKMATYESEQLMENSGVYSSDQNISYGGVDNDGTVEAESRNAQGLWED